MATPFEKSEAIERFLTEFTGVVRPEMVKRNVCVTCRMLAEVFRDPLSRREYRISGMCQRCQDKVFGE